MITREEVKELRDRTGISIMQCREALERANGSMSKALEYLKEKGASIKEKKGTRTLGAGAVEAYVHTNRRIGAMVILHSETDFVAANPEFVKLARDIAMQIAATGTTDVNTLLEEPFIKDPRGSVGALVQNAIQKFGERIEIGKVVYFSSKE